MKEETSIACYKLFKSLNLKKMAGYFRTAGFIGGSTHILLQPEQIKEILNAEAPDKYAWLYKSGSISLVNFEEGETLRFLRNLESISGKVHYNLISGYNERTCVTLKKDASEQELLQQVELYANLLVKSVELRVVEHSVNRIFVQAESFLYDLHSGVPKVKNRFLFRINLDIVRIQLKLITHLKLLDFSEKYRNEAELRDLYHLVSEEYALRTRYRVIQNKINDLDKIISPYQSLGYSWRENRLLILEIILLSLFPILHLLY